MRAAAANSRNDECLLLVVSAYGFGWYTPGGVSPGRTYSSVQPVLVSHAYIGKLGFLEYIIVTPSQHRVHHAMNDIYMDKNYSQIFIVWDRMFGTFQEELATEPCVYGMRRPAQTWNPYIINFKHWYTLAVDAWHTKMCAINFAFGLCPPVGGLPM